MSGFNIGTGFNTFVRSVAAAVDGSGDVYVGGAFRTYDGTFVDGLVRLNSDGTIDTDFDIGTGPDNSVEAIAPALDGSGDVFVGGRFTSYQSTTTDTLVRLDPDGSLD